MRTVSWERDFLCFPFDLASTVLSGQGGKTRGVFPYKSTYG